MTYKHERRFIGLLGEKASSHMAKSGRILNSSRSKDLKGETLQVYKEN